MAKESFATLLEQFQRSKRLVYEELGRTIVGQKSVIEQMFAAVLTRGHCLLVGVPGLAKTLLVSSLARITSLSSNASSSPPTSCRPTSPVRR